MQRIALVALLLFTGCAPKISRITASMNYGNPTMSIEFATVPTNRDCKAAEPFLAAK